jgi:nucleoside-diphosphate-sugar epimerase
VIINPPLAFGPAPRHLSNLDALNTSNHRIRDMIQGKAKEALPPTGPVFIWVDVRDAALAHVRAIEVPQAGGQRFFVVAGHFSNKRIMDIIRESHPELASKLPPEDAADDMPADVYGYDNRKSREVLGMTYRDLKACVDDAVESMMDAGA